MISEANTSGLVRMFSLRHEFPTDWHQFASSDTSNFRTTIKKEHFPYFTQGLNIENLDFQLLAIEDSALDPLALTEDDIEASINDSPLADDKKLRHQLNLLNETEREGDIEIAQSVLDKDQEVYLMIRYTAT